MYASISLALASLWLTNQGCYSEPVSYNRFNIKQWELRCAHKVLQNYHGPSLISLKDKFPYMIWFTLRRDGTAVWPHRFAVENGQHQRTINAEDEAAIKSLESAVIQASPYSDCPKFRKNYRPVISLLINPMCKDAPLNFWWADFPGEARQIDLDKNHTAGIVEPMFAAIAQHFHADQHGDSPCAAVTFIADPNGSADLLGPIDWVYNKGRRVQVTSMKPLQRSLMQAVKAAVPLSVPKNKFGEAEPVACVLVYERHAKPQLKLCYYGCYGRLPEIVRVH